MKNFENLTTLPGTDQERQWLEERLETLSVREEIILSAALLRQPPESMTEGINHLLSLEDYGLAYPVSGYKELGEFFLRQNGTVPEDVIPYTDLFQMGTLYEDSHPGLFIGNCYVEYPHDLKMPRYAWHGGPIPEDTGWSVKIKVASPAVLDGVWLRLPDHPDVDGGRSMEVMLALNELKVRDLDECTLLDARCGLPDAGNLMLQYDSIAELVRDGNDLGFILDEQGQGVPRFMERYTAALEYENCCDLRQALDISQNLSCYEWVPRDELKGLGERKLREAGVSETLLGSGCIDLEGYAAEQLESAGYMLSSDEQSYVTRNSREFIYDRSDPPQEMGMTM